MNKTLLYFPSYFFRDSYNEYGWIIKEIIDYLSSESCPHIQRYKVFCSKFQREFILEGNSKFNPDSFVDVKDDGGVFRLMRQICFEKYNLKQAQLITNFQFGQDDRKKLILLKSYQDVILDSLYDVYPFDVIATWGNNFHMKQWAKAKNIKTLFVELGYLRSPSVPSVVIDENGVNSESTLSLLGEADFDKVSIPPFELISQSIFENQRGKLKAHEKSLKIFNGCSQLDCTWLPSANDQPVDDLNNEAPSVCIYLQLADDTQVLGGSGFTSMLEYVQFIINYIQLNWPENTQVYLRFHPAALGSSARAINAFDALEVAQYIKSFPNVHMMEASWMDASINCDAIFGINSSSLFESWLFNPRVKLYISGFPGWYPCKDLRSKYWDNNDIVPFVSECNPDILKKASLLTVSGYLKKWDGKGKSLIDLIEYSSLFSVQSSNLPSFSYAPVHPYATLDRSPMYAAKAIMTAAVQLFGLTMSVEELRIWLIWMSQMAPPFNHFTSSIALLELLVGEENIINCENLSIRETVSENKVSFVVDLNETPLLDMSLLDVFVFDEMDSLLLGRADMRHSEKPHNMIEIECNLHQNDYIESLRDYSFVFFSKSQVGKSCLCRCTHQF